VSDLHNGKATVSIQISILRLHKKNRDNSLSADEYTSKGIDIYPNNLSYPTAAGTFKLYSTKVLVL
jgi:hypothetical protein